MTANQRLKATDWGLLNTLMELLAVRKKKSFAVLSYCSLVTHHIQPLNEASLAVQARAFPSLALVVPTMERVRRKLGAIDLSTNPDLFRSRKAALEKLSAYEALVQRPIYHVATGEFIDQVSAPFCLT